MQGNAKEVPMPVFQPVITASQSEFVDKLRWIIRAAKRADGLINAAELEKVINQYNPA